MSPIAGERDNLILNANPRFAPANDRVLLLKSSSNIFKVIATSTNTAEPGSIDFVADLVNMTGTVTFSTLNGSALTINGNTATLAYTGMVGNSETVTAAIVVEGRTYTASATVARVYDGATGEDGAPGQNVGRVPIYQRSDSSIAPTLPTVNATYTYATGALSGLNNGWLATVPTAGGFYLYTSSAPVNGTGATRTITPGEWQTAALLVQNGAPGDDGIPGNSARIAYSKTALTSLASTPTTISTSGPSSYPPAGTWGADTVWVGSPPATGAGETAYRVDGVYSPATGVTTWTVPYQNFFKVAKLSAISADIGNILSGDIYGTVLHGGPGYAHATYTWPPSASGGGFHLSEQGLRIGNPLASGFFRVDSNGDIYTPQFTSIGALATFSGTLNAATGTFGLIRSPARVADPSAAGYDVRPNGMYFYDGVNSLPYLELGEYLT